MLKSNALNFKKISVYLLISWLAFNGTLPSSVSKWNTDSLQQLLAQKASAQEKEIPQGWESYLSRPDILTMPAQSHDLGSGWKKLKKAHFSFVAELLAIHEPNTHLYFLARDSEHLYDVAKLVTEGTADAKRIHLLNVSRANMRDKNIMKYLVENGISEEALVKGKKVLFVDTGFAGTIPRVIAENFSAAAKANLKTQLVVSSNPEHPSSRAFLIHLNPMVNQSGPAAMHSTIISYEHMPRYTDRSSQYFQYQGKTHPISLVNNEADGSVSKEISAKHMQDLKASWQKAEVKARYQYEYKRFLWLKEVVKTDNYQEKMKAELLKLENQSEKDIFEAQIKDFAQVSEVLMKQTINISDLGFVDSQILNEGISKKNLLIKQFPDWAPVLENPDQTIPELFKMKNWLMIGNLIDANVDSEINEIILKNLFDGPAVGLKKDMQISFIEKADQFTLSTLVKSAFSQPHVVQMTDLVRLVIEKGDKVVLRYVANDIFSKPHVVQMKDLLQLLIEKGDQIVLNRLAAHTFSQPYTEQMTDLLRLVIEKGDSSVLINLAVNVFRKPHTEKMTDLLRMIIEKGDRDVLKYLADYTFTQPHAQSALHLILKESLSIQDATKRAKFLKKNLDLDTAKQKTSVRSKNKTTSTMNNYRCESVFR